MKGKSLILFFWLIVLLLLGATDLSAQTILQEFVSIGAPAEVIDMDLPKPSLKGSTLIAMPGPLSAGIKVVSITDNAPAGGNVYKQVPGASSTSDGKSLDIWYCENCNPRVTELKFHLSALAKGSINTFLEVSDLALSSVVDGTGANVSDATAAGDGLKVGPSITTTANDFVIARFKSAGKNPTGVTPSGWTYKTTHVYALNQPPGTYQPTLTGGTPGGSYCISMAAFKTVAAAVVSKASPQAGFGARHFPF